MRRISFYLSLPYESFFFCEIASCLEGHIILSASNDSDCTEYTLLCPPTPLPKVEALNIAHAGPFVRPSVRQSTMDALFAMDADMQLNLVY